MYETKNSELFEKYDVPGPRYTSYPTVPCWEGGVSEDQWLMQLQQAMQQSGGIGLYLHIPFCRSLCTYCGCNTRITRNPSVAGPYIDSIHQEWNLYLERLKGLQGASLQELHLGGGTPTFLEPSGLKRLLAPILQSTRTLENAELSIEVDPRVTSTEHLRTLSGLGFNRISLGVQDFDPKVQSMVNRVQSVEMVREVTENARSLGYSSVNYDLIYGLPFQTRESVGQTLRKVIELSPDRIAFYSYAHVPWIKPAHRRWTEEDLPSGTEKRRLYETGRELLETAGYREIGLDHFAKETDSLWKSFVSGRLHRNFMGYASTSASPLLGLGVSAIGDSGGAFAQNEKHLEEYYRRLARRELPIVRGHFLNEEDRVLRRHILNLTTRLHTEWGRSADFTPYLQGVARKLEEMERDGLVLLSGDSCRITEKGRPFMRNACMAFDARLDRSDKGGRLFSRTV